MSQRKLKHMGLEGRNDAIQAAIRSNHLELNMGIPYAATHCGLPPDVCVQHTVGVPSLQSLCRDFLCRNEVPLTRESAPSVDPASVLDVDDLLQDVPSAMRAKMEVCTTPHLDFSVPWMVTYPERWHLLSKRERRDMLCNFKNDVALVKLGLLSEDTVDLSYIDANDVRVRTNRRKRKIYEQTLFSPDDLDFLLDELFTLQ